MTEISESEYIRVLTIKGANGESRTMELPMKLDLDRPKRPRTTFSDDQLRRLEEAFIANGYVTGKKRTDLAILLGLTDTQVKVWFQNRRTKDRRKHTQTVSPQPSPPVSLTSNAPPMQLQYPLSIHAHQTPFIFSPYNVVGNFVSYC